MVRARVRVRAAGMPAAAAAVVRGAATPDLAPLPSAAAVRARVRATVRVRVRVRVSVRCSP